MLTATPADTRRLVVPRLAAAARQPVPADSVAALRIAFGLLIVVSTVRFLRNGWVDRLYLAPEHHLTFPGFSWVEPWPTPLMYLHVAALVMLGVAIAAGYRTRVSAALFVVGFAYIELIDAALYLNHYWFVTLIGVLMVLLPTGGRWSLDARLGREPTTTDVPALVVWAFRAQVGAVYLFAGLAKLNGDWLLRAEPLRLWLADHTDLAIVGPWLDTPAVAYAASWSGAFFDCTVIGWLLWRRSRPLAYAVLVVFHLSTGMLFPIGVFPLVMIAMATIFFSPDWPAVRPCRRPVAAPTVASIGPLPLLVVAMFAALQVVLPLRHYALPGNVRWNEQGYHLAWRVMLTEKIGWAEFEVTDPVDGRTWLVNPATVLADFQLGPALTRPDLIVATARLIEEDAAAGSGGDLEVRARTVVSMNGRPGQPIVRPDIDLTGPLPTDWIVPLRGRSP